MSAFARPAPQPLGDPATDAAALAQNEADVQAQLQSAMTPAQLSTVVSTYTGLTQVQQQSIVQSVGALQRGQVPSWGTLSPLVAGGLELLGVAAPVVAVVAAAVPLIPAILGALHINTGESNCTWTVGAACFSGHIPYGPGDPTWQTWDAFVAANPTQAAQARPWWFVAIACELAIIDAVLAEAFPGANEKVSTFANPQTLEQTTAPKATGILGWQSTGAAPPPSNVGGVSPSDPTINVYLFLRTFYSAWQSNAERAINGHPYTSDADLLAQVANSWNETHGASPTYTFQPVTSARGQVLSALTEMAQGTGAVSSESPCLVVPGMDLADPDTPTYVSMILAGLIDNADEPPLPIHLGPTAPVASSSTSSSSGSSLALAAGGITLAGALLFLLKNGTSLPGLGARR